MLFRLKEVMMVIDGDREEQRTRLALGIKYKRRENSRAEYEQDLTGTAKANSQD